MPSPYVCAVCGQPITLGRHKSGWRHTNESHSDHRILKLPRKQYRLLMDPKRSSGGNEEGEGK